jgi:hypothetical protein
MPLQAASLRCYRRRPETIGSRPETEPERGRPAAERPSFNALHDALFDCFDGFTGPETVLRLRRTSPGEYRSEETNERIPDENRQYRIALPASRFEELRAVLRRAANTFDQESMFLAIQGEVEFVKATKADGTLADPRGT